MSSHPDTSTPLDSTGRHTGEPPARSKREIWTAMSGLMLCMLLAMLDNTIVTPALPTIVGDLGGVSSLSWVITAYTLATAVTTLLWGKLGDLFGRKPILLASVTIFLAGSALAGLAQSMTWLIGSRALQGLGAGGLVVGVMSVIPELIPPRERGRYMGAMASVMPLGMIGGPLLGGWITDHISWHWIFYINLPVGIIAMSVILATLHLPARQRIREPADWLGAGLLAVWASAIVLLASWAGTEYDWGSWQIAVLAAVFVAGLAAFIVRERRAADPILPLGIFRNRNFTISGVLMFLVGVTMMTGIVYLPQFQQLVQGMSATSSGLLLLPMLLPMIVTVIITGQAMSRTGRSRVFPIVGGAFLLAGTILLTTVRVDTTTTVTGLMMALLGIGIGLFMQPGQVIAQNNVELHHVGAGMGANRFLQFMGITIGTAITGALYTSRLTARLTDSLGPDGERLGSGGTDLSPSMIDSLPQSAVNAVHHAVTYGIHEVFWIAAGFAAAGLIVSLLLKEVPLHSTAEAETGSER